uniref:RdRp catalytic domain-containing protein n=1 Tax=Behai endorna-like virus 1 TaxID=1922349 RepID=A0A1L3KJH9_9VIRU|nr:hypothetical protein [Behai endorna-like virus 1]
MTNQSVYKTNLQHIQRSISWQPNWQPFQSFIERKFPTSAKQITHEVAQQLFPERDQVILVNNQKYFQNYSLGIYQLCLDKQDYSATANKYGMNCVLCCVQDQIDSKNNYGMALLQIVKVQFWDKPISKQLIMNICFKVKCNLMLIDQNQPTKMQVVKMHKRASYIRIYVKTTAMMLRHAQSLIIKLQKKKLQGRILFRKNLSQLVCESDMHQLLTRIQSSRLYMQPKLFKQMIGLVSGDNKVMIKSQTDIKARIKSDKLTVLSSRTWYMCLKIKIIQTVIGYMIDSQYLNNGDLICVLTNKGWVTTIVIKFKTSLNTFETYLLPTFDVLQYGGMCYKLGMNVIKQPQKSNKNVQRRAPQIAVWNRQTQVIFTQQYGRQNVAILHQLVAQWNIQTIYCMHHDNRKHHNYDMLAKTENFKFITFVDVNMNQVNKQQLIKTYNAAINRMIIRNGVIMYNIQLTSIMQLKIFRAQKKYLNQSSGQIYQQNNVYQFEPFNDHFIKQLVINDNNCRFDDSKHHNDTINNWVSTLPKITNYNQWAEQLNLSIQQVLTAQTMRLIPNGTRIKFKVIPFNQKFGQLKYKQRIGRDEIMLLQRPTYHIYIRSTRVVVSLSQIGGSLDWTKQSLQHMIYQPNYRITSDQFVQGQFTLNFSQRLNQNEKLARVNQFKELNKHKIQSLQTQLFNQYETDQAYQMPMLNQLTQQQQQYLQSPYVQAFWTQDSQLHGGQQQLVSAQLINLWQQGDLTQYVQLKLPHKRHLIRTTQQPTSIKQISKYKLTDYPLTSRPVISQMHGIQYNTITDRVHGVVDYKKIKINVIKQFNQFVKVYFKKNASAVTHMQMNPIKVSLQQSINWLANAQRNNVKLIDLIKLIHNDISLRNFNDIKMHIKSQVLTKQSPKDFKQMSARSILWQRYAISAVFSPVFLKIKQRFKQMLIPTVVYADGLRPDELYARCKSVQLNNQKSCFVQNDLQKQDKQTVMQIIQIQMLIYKYLGMQNNLVDFWRLMHIDWQLRSKYSTTMATAQRLTGQATTAIGNVITNLIVHTDFIKYNMSQLKLMLVLGDDFVAIMNRQPQIMNLRQHIKVKYNMISKASFNYNYGNFCQLVLYNTPDNCVGIGPDYVRLKRRFEVCNNIKASNDQNQQLKYSILQCKSMSYLMMLGDNINTKKIIEKYKYPIKPLKWYDIQPLQQALCEKHNVSQYYIQNQKALLYKMIQQLNAQQVKLSIWSNKYYLSERVFRQTHSDN